MAKEKPTGLARRMGLLGLVATGVCSMVGAAINVIPIMIQRSVPEIGPYVLPAYALAVVPAALAALAYAVLASAMPRAGGSYVYASRALNPYLGFVASFSQWFGLCVAMGVVSYLLIPFLRDIAAALSWSGLAAQLDFGPIRLALALGFLWIFAIVNLLGVRIYERTLIPLMFLMFVGGAVVIPWGFAFDHGDFLAAAALREGAEPVLRAAGSPSWSALPAAMAILFSTFIGFDSIAQAGGEAKNPNRTLPLAIGICLAAVAAYYMLFTSAVYHAVPWQFVAERAQTTDLTAPGLLGYLLSPGWTVAIVAGAAVALINDLPAMILAVSRLMFAWADDGIFPEVVSRINSRYRTPHYAILGSALTASAGILGCHLASDFFLGVDVLIVSMLANFLLMCVAVLALPRRNPPLARQIRFARSRRAQMAIGGAGVFVLGGLMAAQAVKDLSTAQPAWYYHSTLVWLFVVAVASLLFFWKWRRLVRSGIDLGQRFRELPTEGGG